jgi:hypothetical protein
LSLPFLVFQPPFHPDNSHLAFISEFYVQMLYLPDLKNVVVDFLPRPNQTTTGSVASASAGDPVDFEEMAAEQSRCPETQRLLGCTSLKLAFRQTGAQHLAGNASTGNCRCSSLRDCSSVGHSNTAAPLDAGSGTPSGQVS